MPLETARYIWPYAMLAAIAAALLLPSLHQPLLENYVDRQCHTAMVARNLLRGGSLLYPTIDVGPFPAYYMLELPLYPWLAGCLHRLTPLPLDAAGRLVSCVATIAATVLLFDLLRRSHSVYAALSACILVVTTPVVLRYGRAFQPDALLLFCLVLSVWAAHTRGPILGWASAALAILLKGTAAWIVLVVGMCRRAKGDRWPRIVAAGVVAFLPAAAWYLHAAAVSRATAAGVSADFWALHKWLPLHGLGVGSVLGELLYRLGWRSLGPALSVAAIGGVVLGLHRRVLPTWASYWAAGLVTFVPVLLRKADHEHYYLVLLPAGAAAAAVLVDRLRNREGSLGKLVWPVAAGLCSVAVVVAGRVAWSTRQVPNEWRDVLAAAAELRRLTRAEELVVGHSSVLFYADRRGYAVAHRPADIRQWLLKWGQEGRRLVQLAEQRAGRPGGHAASLVAPDVARRTARVSSSARTVGWGSMSAPPLGAAGRTGLSPYVLLELYARHGAVVLVELDRSVALVPGGQAYLDSLHRRYAVVKRKPGAYVVVRLRRVSHLAARAPRGATGSAPDGLASGRQLDVMHDVTDSRGVTHAGTDFAMMARYLRRRGVTATGPWNVAARAAVDADCSDCARRWTCQGGSSRAGCYGRGRPGGPAD